VRRVLAVVVAVVVGVTLWWVSAASEGGHPARLGTNADQTWDGMDAQARCDHALRLVTSRARWPTRCRWREAGETLAGQSFPPPIGPPPYDEPRVEIYVAREQVPEEVANVIAHEYGHMHHTREPAFIADWLDARNLPPETRSEVWTEDYAEVFATLFSPPSPGWRAPTARPSPGALADLRARFFGGA
jgi:hypothetical protein